MRYWLVFFLLLLVACCSAEQVIEHGGRDIVTFDVPDVEYKTTREGKYTRTYFSQKIGNGNLRITVTSKGWMSELKAEQRYQSDKRDKRNHQGTRLREDAEVEGAMRALCYSTTSPYRGEAIVLYTPDFRCELLVTGTEEAAEAVEPTYQKLLETLKVVPRTNIRDIKIE